MRLAEYTDYTLRVLMYLALNRDRLVTIVEIAAAYDISAHHLMKVAQHLVRSGLIESTRGKGGGVRLAQEPNAIRIGSVVRNSEGYGPIVECLSEQPDCCRIAPACRLTDILVRAFEALYATLDKYTLADLVQQPQALQTTLLHR